MIIGEIEVGNSEKHKIRYEKNAMTGADKAFVDGKLVKERKVCLSQKFSFEVGENEKHQVTVCYGMKEMFRMQPRFEIDGQSQQSAESNPIPKWGWIFLVACGIIPILTMGGAIPGALGFAGAFPCLAILRDKKMTTGQKVVSCGGITLAVWILFLIFIYWVYKNQIPKN